MHLGCKNIVISDCGNLGGGKVYEFTRLKFGFGHLRMLSGQTKQGRVPIIPTCVNAPEMLITVFFVIRRNCISLLMEINAGFWWEELRERDHLEDVGLKGRA